MGTPLFQVCKKLKLVKEALKSFNQEFVSNIQGRVKEARDKLQQLQVELVGHPGDRRFKGQEREALGILTDMVLAEEQMYQQKSRAMWLTKGDTNIAYFHNSMTDRYNKNKILSLEMEDGQRVFDM